MAEIPTVESVFGARRAPSANASVYSYTAGQEARAAQRAGEVVSNSASDRVQIAKQKQKDLEELDLVRAQTFAFKEYATLENEMRNDPDQSWEKYNPLFAQRAEAAASMIKNPVLAEKFKLGLDQEITRKQILSSQITKKKTDDQIYSEFIRDNEDMKNLASALLLNGDKEGAAVALAQAERRSLAMAKAGIAEWDMTKHELFMASDDQKNKYDVLVNAYGQDSPEKISELVSPYKNSKVPLSVRNNNPGNIRGKDGKFIKYATPQDGMDAMRKDLMIKLSGKSGAVSKNFGKDYIPTLTNVISTYAPSNENDTGAYIAAISKATGLSPNQPLSAGDVEKIMPAMIRHEGGQIASDYYSTGKLDNSLLTQSPLGYMSFDTQSKLMDFANTRIKQLAPQRIQNDIMFATPQQINDSRQKYTGYEDEFNKVLQERDKIIKEDNAGFINQHPTVSPYYEQMAQDPMNADKRAQYFTAFDRTQDEMGVPTYLRSYIPKAEVEQIKTVIKSAQKLDDIERQSNNIKLKYGERFPEVVSQMRREQVDPLFIEYTMLDPVTNGGQKESLYNAMRAGTEGLNKISTVETSVLNDKISAAMAPIQEVWAKGDKTNLTMLAPQKVDAMNSLVKYRLSAGDDIDKAVKYASDVVLPYQVVDDLVLSKSFTPVQANNIAVTGKAAKDNLSLVEIMPPPDLIDSVGGIDKVTESVFNEYVQRNVTAVVNGNDILFYDATGNPLIDKNVLESTGDEFEAIYKRNLSLSASVALSEEKTSNDLIRIRADISKEANGNDIAMTKFNQEFMSRFRSTAIGFYDEKNPHLVKVSPIIDDDFLGVLKSGKPNKFQKDFYNAEIKRARVNHAYFKQVLESLPESARPKLLELAKKSNEAHIEKATAIKRFNERLKKDREGLDGPSINALRQTQIDTLKNINSIIDTGIGYNYIELPDWAK